MTAPLACELRVLVVAGPADDPTTRAWSVELDRVGVPFDLVTPSAEDPLRAADLVAREDPRVGRYNAVVLGTDSSVFWGALDDLAVYRQRFGVRQVCGFEYPRSELGLTSGVGAVMAGTSASLTASGRELFPYLRGPVPLDMGSYGYLAHPLEGTEFTSMVQTPGGNPLVGVYRRGGIEDLVLTVNYAEAMLHWRLLAKGLLDWVTRGTHFGYSRNYLACHVDDVFLANWVGPAPTGVDAASPHPRVRMTAEDVTVALEWQSRVGFTLDLAYNGAGAFDHDGSFEGGPSVGGAPDARAEDELTTALLASRDRFRWINHTWNHIDLGRTSDVAPGATPDAAPEGVQDPSREWAGDWRSVDEICDQIARNVDWARSVDLPVSPTALVTGAHSGLDNPNLPAALARTGVTAIASDASRSLEQTQIGPASTVPRYPTNVYTAASTWAEQIAEYAARYGADAPGAASPEAFLAAESEILLQHMLSNDPRPTFAHQSNLTRDRLLLALLGSALRLYRTYLGEGCDLRSPTMDDAAADLARRSRWRDAVEKGEVVGRVGDGEIVVTSDADVDVPLTVPTGTVDERRQRLRRRPFGEAYAGTSSAWHPVVPGERLRLLCRSI